jgi:DNA-binding NarL/FixJ family response regulator
MVVIEGLKALLADRAGLQVVGEATDGCDGLGKVSILRPQIIVTEYRLPLVNGPLVLRFAKPFTNWLVEHLVRRTSAIYEQPVRH